MGICWHTVIRIALQKIGNEQFSEAGFSQKKAYNFDIHGLANYFED